MPYLGPGIDNGYRSRFIYTATAGQTSFSGGDSQGITLTYTDSEYLDVYQNGVLLVPGDDYAATTGTTVVLVQGASLNDKVEMIQYQAFGVADTVSRADGGAFGGNIGIGGTLSVTGATTLATKLATTNLATGAVVQVVNVQTGAVATGTTVIPADDTIPQKTEGDEFMTLAITPTSSSNKLKIDVVAQIGNNSANSSNTVALFQDSTANAIAVALNMESGAEFVGNTKFTHYMTSGTTSATTFKVRAGSNQSATTTFNGRDSGRFFGGVFASSITITEIAV